MNGRGMPVTGIMPIAIPIFSNVWKSHIPGEPQVYYYYAEDKTEVYWVHFTGSQVEEYLDYYKLPKNENVFFYQCIP